LKVCISSYSGKKWENEFYGLIRTFLSGYDLPYRIFKKCLWEAFSKIKFNRRSFLTEFMVTLGDYFRKLLINLVI
jgi:hypothetical protein